MALYDAFVSYSHAKDKPIAAALQSVIQKLGKPWYRRRALRVFRDDTSLSATPSLWPSIEQALGNSRFLILLASPEAAASPWVNKEISYWLDHKSADTLLIALTDGELAWDNAFGDFVWREGLPLPPVLTGRFASEPKWVDLTGLREAADARNAKFIEAGANFAAAIHGLPKEDLLSQEVRQQRRALTLAWSAAASLLVLVGLAGWQWWEADSAKRIAQRDRDRAERNFDIAKTAADEVLFKFVQGLRNVQSMRAEEVHRILDTARRMMDQLTTAAPDDVGLQRNRAVLLTEFVETYIRAGDISKAGAAADESVVILRSLIAADPSEHRLQADLCLSLVRVGNVRLAAGDRVGALAAYEDSLATARKLAGADPGNATWQDLITIGLDKVGDARLAAGDRAGALAVYEDGLVIRRNLAAGGDANLQRGVSVSLDKVGDLRLALGDWASAVAAHEEGLANLRRLAAADPSNTALQADVSVSLHKVGDARRVAGDRSLAPYEESLAIRRRLVADDPGNDRWQRGVSVGLEKVGDIRLVAGDRAGAFAAYEEGLAILRRLAAADTGNAGWQRDLGVSLEKIGDVRLAAGDRAGALAGYKEALTIRRRLAAADPGNALWQTDLVVGLSKVSSLSEPAEARAALGEALIMVETLARENKLTFAQKAWPQMLRDALARLPPQAADAP